MKKITPLSFECSRCGDKMLEIEISILGDKTLCPLCDHMHLEFAELAHFGKRQPSSALAIQVRSGFAPA